MASRGIDGLGDSNLQFCGEDAQQAINTFLAFPGAKRD